MVILFNGSYERVYMANIKYMNDCSYMIHRGLWHAYAHARTRNGRKFFFYENPDFHS